MQMITQHGVVAVLALLVCIPAEALQLSSPSPVSPGTVEQEYRIQVGDELDIKFFYNPDLNENVIVRPDGRISLQLISEVIVAQMTPAALAKELTERYSKDLKQPQVAVIVRAFGAQRIYVDGEVGSPGMVPILGPLTVLQAISQAGGMREAARTTEVIIIRRGAENKPLAFQVNLRDVRSGSDLSQDVALAPFDIVYVPRSRISNVNSWLDQYVRKNIPIPFGFYFGVNQ